jgi:aspartyl/asparaginyl-tRNA synthetase
MFARGKQVSQVRRVFVVGVLIGLGLAAGPVNAQKSAPPTQIAEITTEYAGKRVTVEGVVESGRAFKAGQRFKIRDESGAITAVLFDRAFKPQPGIDPGAIVRVAGKIDFYKNEAQIVPAGPRDVTVISAAPKATVTSLDAFASLEKGARVTIGGQIVDANAFSAGFKLSLDDGRGRGRAVLFEKTFDRFAQAHALAIGAQVTLTGAIDDYNGERELVVERVEAVEPVAQPIARDYQLSAINGNDHNALVRVTGEIAEIGSGDGKRESDVVLVLKDGGGAQKIRLLGIVAERVKTRVGLQPTQKIVLVGRVRASRASGVRIEVALPGDVQESS